MEELERLICLLEKSNAPIWSIWTLDSAPKRKPEFKGENLEQSVGYLRDVFPFLSKQKYELRYRALSSNEKGQFHENFDLTEPKKMYQNQQNPPINYNQNQDASLFIKVLDLIQMMESMKHKISNLEEKYNSLDKDIDNIYKDLSDENPKNDKSAIERLGQISQQIPSILNSVKSAKELF